MEKLKSVLLVILVVSKIVNLADGSSFYFVKQYCECKNLKMIPNNRSMQYEYYPDPNVPNNYLDDTYYQRQGFLNRTFDEAMSYFQTMYAEIRNPPRATPNLTICFDSVLVNTVADPGVLFRNATTLASVKQIATAFINKFRPFFVGISSYLMGFIPEASELPTLIQFILRNDVSLSRFYFYNNSMNKCNDLDFSEEELMIEACKINDAMINRYFPVKPYSNVDMEQLMKCNLLTSINCSLEYQRYYAMNVWAHEFPNLTWTGSLNFTGFLDRVIRAAVSYKPSFEYVDSSFEILYGRNFKFELFNRVVLNVEYPEDENIKNINLMLFNSRLLRIDFRINWNAESEYTWMLNLILFQTNSSVPLLTQSINSSSIPLIKSGTLVRVRNVSVLQMLHEIDNTEIFEAIHERPRQLYVLDFNSKCLISMTDDQVNLKCPKSLVESASGPMVNWFA